MIRRTRSEHTRERACSIAGKSNCRAPQLEGLYMQYFGSINILENGGIKLLPFTHDVVELHEHIYRVAQSALFAICKYRPPATGPTLWAVNSSDSGDVCLELVQSVLLV